MGLLIDVREVSALVCGHDQLRQLLQQNVLRYWDWIRQNYAVILEVAMLTDMLCICFHYDRYLNLEKKFHTGIVDSIRKENKLMKSVISIGNQDFISI